MAKKNPLVSPILKWVGGKRQLLDSIEPLIPQCSTYYEPFIGGGAVLFSRQPDKAVINDSNPELINVYLTIKDEPEALIEKLKEHKANSSEEYYYSIRALDRDKSVFENMTNVERAARIIYLNKTCYNGLFRVNSCGEFNSPWGRYNNPNITYIVGHLHKSFDVNEVEGIKDDYIEEINDRSRDEYYVRDNICLEIKGDDFNGRRNSNAWAALKSSIANTRSTFCITL